MFLRSRVEQGVQQQTENDCSEGMKAFALLANKGYRTNPDSNAVRPTGSRRSAGDHAESQQAVMDVVLVGDVEALALGRRAGRRQTPCRRWDPG